MKELLDLLAVLILATAGGCLLLLLIVSGVRARQRPESEWGDLFTVCCVLAGCIAIMWALARFGGAT